MTGERLCEGVTLYEGDALGVLPTFADASFDAVVSDPPFGVRDEDWDDMDDRMFARFSMAWLSQARRVAKEGVFFCSAYGPFRHLCELLWPRVRVMVWDKPIGSQYAGASERKLWFAHETILHCYTPEAREYTAPKMAAVGAAIKEAREAAGLSRGGVDIAVRGKKTGLCYRWEEGACLPTREQAKQLQTVLDLNGDFAALLATAYDDRNETLTAARAGASENAARGRDVFTYRTETDVLHPCQKPLPLMKELIHRLTDDEAKILDPFAGSGSTLVAATMLCRPVVGIEQDAGHCATIRRRVAHAAGKGSLFEGAAP